MNDLIIRYTYSIKDKALISFAGVLLLLTSSFIGISQASANQFKFWFFVGVGGILVALLVILLFTIWQPKPILTINGEEFLVHLPKQKVNGNISWDSVSQIGIGLSFITMATDENRNYKIDLENLKYCDLKAVKTKIIEVCEARGIPYTNI